MTAKRAMTGLGISFALWMILEAAGVGLSAVWYLAFCAIWIFGPWAAREIVHKYPGVWRVIGYTWIACFIGAILGGFFGLAISPLAGWIVGGAWFVLAFGVLCICGTAR